MITDEYSFRRQELATYLGSDQAVEWLLRITAATESAFKDAVNPHSGAMGMFQFLPGIRKSLKEKYPWLPEYELGNYDAQSQYAVVLYSDILRTFRHRKRLPAFISRYNAARPAAPLRIRTRILQYGYHAGLGDEPPIRTSKKTGEKQDTAPEVMSALQKVDKWWAFAMGSGPSPSKIISDKYMTGDILSGELKGGIPC